MKFSKLCNYLIEDKRILKNIKVYDKEKQLEQFKNDLSKSNDFSAWLWKKNDKLKLIVYDNGKSDANQRHPVLASFYFEEFEPEVYKMLTDKEGDFESNLKEYMFNELKAIRMSHYKSFKSFVINYNESTDLAKDYVYELIKDWPNKVQLESKDKHLTDKKHIIQFLKTNQLNYVSPLSQFR